jgi:hypothetical protein
MNVRRLPGLGHSNPNGGHYHDILVGSLLFVLLDPLQDFIQYRTQCEPLLGRMVLDTWRDFVVRLAPENSLQYGLLSYR